MVGSSEIDVKEPVETISFVWILIRSIITGWGLFSGFMMLIAVAEPYRRENLKKFYSSVWQMIGKLECLNFR